MFTIYLQRRSLHLVIRKSEQIRWNRMIHGPSGYADMDPGAHILFVPDLHYNITLPGVVGMLGNGQYTIISLQRNLAV